MIKKYLTTPEEILALRQTNTKIYNESCETEEIYYQFVDGVLCEFVRDDGFIFNTDLPLSKLYILVEGLEVTEEDEGKLCWFWDDEEKEKTLGILYMIDIKSETEHRYFRKSQFTTAWKHCRRLTPEELAKVLGVSLDKCNSLLREYADYGLGVKIRDCIKEHGSCQFDAEC